MEMTYKTLAREGLWDNNPVLAQSLALCPLLAVTTSATNGLGMGLATLLVIVATSVIISLLREIITPEVRIPVFILLIAATVTIVDMMMNAFVHDLYKVLGLFIPLIVTNCMILGRAESFASRFPVKLAALDGLMMGLGFLWVLVLLGAIREIIGSGTLFANASLLLGQSFAFMELTLIPDYKGYLIMILPPGGFLVMGFLMAGKRVLDARLEQANQAAVAQAA
ncbi:electron transport complex subunit E [Candidatus Albibeggiatoa sp. nov. NOAA]|uniref:electron transport complex subunit E n=1 Tax=Candidatus Albibeggiatoa sp. nov. NOAA TaxID=3162724 RepID=UPI0032FBEEC1|nr:electron transport complex subunit E [Thiotrichaceae bacterium]